jgi:RNA polymerase subunit RPABC4/transcription elongation factor Spt4
MNNDIKTKKCKYCMSDIDIKAKICPNCKKSQTSSGGNIFAGVIIGIIVIGIFLAIVIYGSVFVVMGIAYGYWGLSIGMAPVLWILMIIGATVGFVCAAKNAIKAAREIMAEKRS